MDINKILSTHVLSHERNVSENVSSDIRRRRLFTDYDDQNHHHYDHDDQNHCHHYHKEDKEDADNIQHTP